MLLHPIKLQVDNLLRKQSEEVTALTEEETLNLHICKASFMMSIGDQVVKEIQARNPKEDMFDEDLGWIEEKWQETWKSSEYQNQNFVKVMQAKRKKSETIYQFWTRLQGLAVAQSRTRYKWQVSKSE